MDQLKISYTRLRLNILIPSRDQNVQMYFNFNYSFHVFALHVIYIKNKINVCLLQFMNKKVI